MTPDKIPSLKPGDWVATRLDYFCRPQIAKIKAVTSAEDGLCGEPSLDLIIFDIDGTRIGRESPAMGGPRSFEPCCAVEGWFAIKKPDFPLPYPHWGDSLEYLDADGIDRGVDSQTLSSPTQQP